MKQPHPTRACVFCGQSETVMLDRAKIQRWQAGELVQDVWPEMRAEVRELLISGTHGACWDANMREEEE